MPKDRAAGSRLCQKCGATIHDDSSASCSACLLEAGLHLLTDDGPGSKREPVLAEFGDYELLEEIGRGGQGLIYRARQKSLNRLVALKVIGLGHLAGATHLKRFRREAEAAASLEHPGIVPIYDVGEHDGACFYSMQFIEGGRLDEFVRREPLPLRRAVEIIARLAHTVQYAHERGILHRDIKPGNILLDDKGEPHLADFGLARLVETESTVTRTRDILGTPSYIAPEQAAGNCAALTSATDVYGLGAVFYQLLTGHPPFAGGTTYETIRLVLETEPRSPRLWNPKVDRDLTTICLKCLEKDLQRRYPSACALAEDLERWLGHEPIQARRTGVVSRSGKWIRRNPTMAVLLPLLLALSAAIGMLFWNREPARPPAGIAVLPFENLDGDKEDATFADGIQDDILTKLAKVADLKVISRTSVMQYRGAQNTRQIGQALHVSHVLEGSVRRDGNRIRVNTQLIDTRTDQHVWAEEYDRGLTDVFATQTEIAQKIAEQLHARISPREKAAIEQQPTKDIMAYNLYVEAAAMIDKNPYEAGKEQKIFYFKAIDLLNQAIARDPAFLLAYCRLAEAHDSVYQNGTDHTPARLALAKSAIDSAFRVQPNSGEAHLALAWHLYRGYLDYDHSRDELDIAIRTLPNNPRIYEWNGHIDRRQNRWPDAVRDFNHAVELDPQNPRILHHAAVTYWALRDYKTFRKLNERIDALHPNEHHEIGNAFWDISERADTRPLHALLERERIDDADISETRLQLALYERDTAAAERALAKLTDDGFDTRGVGSTTFTRAYLKALIARIKGDSTAAAAAFTAARAEQEKTMRAFPDNGPPVVVLGLIDAALGRKEEALREGRRAVELSEKDYFDFADTIYYYGVICLWVGKHDLAIEQLQASAKMPGGINYGEIRLDPHWDSLRTDPRFDKIVASLAPKDAEKISQRSP